MSSIGQLRQRHRFFSVVQSWAPMFLEIAITVASARMAMLLFRDQGYFEKYARFYVWLLAHFPNDEWKWGLMATAAAALKGVGMLCIIFRGNDRAMEVAFILRELGWAISVVFWGTLGLSIQFGDPWSLGAICCGTLAPLSFAALVMGPAMPEVSRAGFEG